MDCEPCKYGVGLVTCAFFESLTVVRRLEGNMKGSVEF